MSLSTAEAWGVTVAGILVLVLALNQLGVDVPMALTSVIHGTEQFLNRSLMSLV